MTNFRSVFNFKPHQKFETPSVSGAVGPVSDYEPLDPPEFTVTKGDTDADDQLCALMNTIKERTLNLKCEQQRVVSDWQIGMDQLTSQMATLQPLLLKSLQRGSEREQTILRLTASETDLKHCLAQAERDLAHYRPINAQLENELRTTRHQLSMATRQAADAEAENTKAQGLINDLHQRVATAESARQQLLEENSANRQRLQKHEVALPKMIREAAELKSQLVSTAADLERVESDLEAMSQKYGSECDEHGRTRAALRDAEAQIRRMQAELKARSDEALERDRRAAERLAGHEKKIYDLEIRQSALLSKIDFLTRLNERQRDELRRQSDHIGNLEASNQQLLNTHPRFTSPLDDEEDAQMAQRKLRAVEV